MLDKKSTDDCRSRMSCDMRVSGLGPAACSMTAAFGTSGLGATEPCSSTSTTLLPPGELMLSGSGREAESKGHARGAGRDNSARHEDVQMRNTGNRDLTAENASPWKVTVLLAAWNKTPHNSWGRRPNAPFLRFILSQAPHAVVPSILSCGIPKSAKLPLAMRSFIFSTNASNDMSTYLVSCVRP